MGIQGFKIIANQRARLVGELQALEKNILKEQARISEIRVKVAAFDEVLRAQGVDVDPDVYAPPVKPTPRLYYFAHGELAGACLHLLRTQRRPLTTPQMFNALVRIKNPIWKNPSDPRKIRILIKNQMGVYMRRGIVVRVYSTGQKGNAEGIWALPEYADIPWEAGAIARP